MKLITFDFWNTLFLDQHEKIRHRKRIAYAHGILVKHCADLDLPDIEKAFQAGHEFFEGQWDHRRACTMQEHVRVLASSLQLDLPDDDLESITDYFETVLLEHPPVLIENAAESIQFAASRAKIGLICDTGYTPGRTLRKILERHDLRRYFHAFSFSNETGVLKPNPVSFKTILDEVGVAPEDSVHIGDLEDSDIAGAKRVGMRAIKYIGSNPSATRETIADAVIDDLRQLPSVLDVFYSRDA